VGEMVVASLLKLLIFLNVTSIYVVIELHVLFRGNCML